MSLIFGCIFRKIYSLLTDALIVPVLHILQTFLNIVGSYETMASANTEAFKYAVLNAIKTSGNGVSPLRINNIQVIFNAPHVFLI